MTAYRKFRKWNTGIGFRNRELLFPVLPIIKKINADRSWVVTLFLLENRDFVGFRMIFKVWVNQIFPNFNTMLWTIKYRFSSITVYFTFTVPELWPFFF